MPSVTRFLPAALPLAFTLAAGIGAAGGSSPPAPRSETRPNVITIVADDLGFGDTSLYGGEIATPNIARLAEQGVTFTDGYVGSPVCSPSRWSLMSGREAPRLGAEGNTIARLVSLPRFTAADGANPSVATLLKQRGYDTMAVGKWDLSAVNPKDTESTIPGHANLPHTVGFDNFWGVLAGISSYCPENAPNTFAYDGENNRYRSVTPDSYLTDALTDQATDFVGAHPSGSDPFFLYLTYNAPHNPFETRNKCDAPGDAAEKESRYIEMVKIMDEGIGRVLDAMDTETRHNTIVTFVSDNGPQHGWVSGPLKGRKSMLFEGGIRVPFVTTWPGHLPAGETSATPVRTVDLLPTYVEAAGGTVDSSYAGSDLVARIRGGSHQPEPYVWRYYNDSRPTGAIAIGTTRLAARKHRWKWTHDILPDGESREHLYDLGIDADGDGLTDGVGEAVDLAGDRRHAAQLQRMRRLYQGWASLTPSRAPLVWFRPATHVPDGFAFLGGTWDGVNDVGLTATAAEGSGASAILPGNYQRASTTSVDVTLTDDARAGLLLRSTIEPGDRTITGYAATMSSSLLTLERFDEGEARQLSTAQIALTPGRHRLQVAAESGQLVVRVDEATLINYTDVSPLNGGSAGLRVDTGVATFRDLVAEPTI